MEVLRKLGLGITTTALFLTTIVLIASIFIVRTIGNEEALKTELQESGIYDAAALNITDKLAISTNALPSEQSLVNEAVETSLNDATIKRTSETFISSTFDWLQGNVATPQFSLQTSDLKAAFSDNLIFLLKNRIAALPPCPANTIPDTTDPFAATCWPPSLSVDAEIAKVQAEIEADTTLFEAQDISAADITIATDSGDQPYYVALQSLPKYYRWLTFTPIIASAVLLLLIGFLYLLGSPHEKGFKVASFVILPIGLFLVLIGSFVPQFSVLIANSVAGNITDGVFTEPTKNLTTNVIQSTGSLLATKGILLSLVAILLFVAYVLVSRIRRKKVRTGRLSKLS